MTVTSPLATVKLLVLNEATPILVSLANSPAINIWLLLTVVLIPSPAAKVIVSPNAIVSVVPVSADIEIPDVDRLFIDNSKNCLFTASKPLTGLSKPVIILLSTFKLPVEDIVISPDELLIVLFATVRLPPITKL